MNNLRFNRIEKRGRHEYIKDFAGIRKIENFEFPGFIKCKLAHSDSYSIVIPDQIYVEIGGQLRWIQPLYFSANSIALLNDTGSCDLAVDISHGICLRIRFFRSNLISRFEDGSFYYACSIKGPKYIYNFTTGDACIINKKPHLKLFHHTTKEAGESILKSKEYWSSNWNIQGTKKSNNIAYLYLTSLPKIVCSDDLEEIAMSSDGRLGFRVDQNPTNIPDLVLKVYRDSTENRTFSLQSWVDSSLLAPQPCYRHMPPDGFGYYAVVSPFIQRIGVKSGSTLRLAGNKIIPYSPISPDYCVVGDATSIDGLRAPYDEENTKDILKIQDIDEGDDIIKFWMHNANSNQFNNKEVTIIKFD